MTDEGKIPCDCGNTMYVYYADAGIVFICFTCGKFDCEGFSKNIEKLFSDEPEIILQLIQDGNLKPLSDIKGI